MNFFKSVNFLKRLRSLATFGMFVMLASSFSCGATDDDNGETGRKVIKVAQVLSGLVASQLEPGMLFVYGATNITPKDLSLPITIGVIGLNAPIHISRLTSCVSTLEDLIEQTGDHAVVAARIVHAFLNGVVPIIYTGIRAERHFPTFSAITIPPRAISAFIRGMEPHDCLANKVLSPVRSGFKQPWGSTVLTTVLSIPKALMIQAMANEVLEDYVGVGNNSRLVISSSLAVASGALTIAFESDKINTLVQKVAQNPWPTLQEIAQAAFLASIYMGVGDELGFSTATVMGIFALETAVEAVSLERHWKKIARWLGL
ncbi:MAG: hypothetical protein J0H87_00575 [Holosporales bacterium]|nr:hypothetical protein [Holosporales bacterium]